MEASSDGLTFQICKLRPKGMQKVGYCCGAGHIEEAHAKAHGSPAFSCGKAKPFGTVETHTIMRRPYLYIPYFLDLLPIATQNVHNRNLICCQKLFLCVVHSLRPPL